MECVGVVREWHSDQGWGVIDSEETPGGCWASFSAVAGDGYRELVAGQQVVMRSERADQDSYRFHALKVWNPGQEPADPAPIYDGTAMSSTLTITFDGDTEERE